MNARPPRLDAVPGEGLEPSSPAGQRILSPPCMPFHHPGAQIHGTFLTCRHLLDLHFSDRTVGEHAFALRALRYTLGRTSSSTIRPCSD
jgi:hypothetical protein